MKQISKEFGTVYLDCNINEKEFDVRKALNSFLGNNGYAVNKCDLTNISTEWELEQANIKFKLVPIIESTAETIPYMTISFKEA